MADLYQITDFTNKYSDNQLSSLSLFYTQPTINFSHSTLSGSLTIVDGYALGDNMKSAEMYIVQDVVSGIFGEFDFGDALSCVGGGVKLFQFSIFPQTINANPDYVVSLEVDIFGDGLLVETFTTDVDLTALEQEYYTFGQSFDSSSYSEINFRFRVQADSVGTPNPNIKINFSGFKCEEDNKQIGVPTIYSYPIDFYLKNTQKFGKYNYNHSGSTQAITSSTWTHVLNDGAGANTILTCAYPDVDIYNTATSYFSMADLPLCSDVEIRFDANVTTTSANQIVRVRAVLAYGVLDIPLQFIDRQYKTAGSNPLFGSVRVDDLTAATQGNPFRLEIWSDASCTLALNGWNLKVNKIQD